ncbi:hypothetical protein [Microbacterium ginsengiterrae]|uniref:hypothetical protein n=1 Tax=Microbacterium ginsengiterrae TaxID=546115 RepID=UPI0018881A6C|nr:hypothetical protein [Microbacterium ginsengiterrae]
MTVSLGVDGFVGLRGHEFTVTEEQYEETRNKFGVSWLDMTVDQQVERWGHQMFASGPAPEGMGIGRDDIHGARHRQWMRATEEAQRISDPDERAVAFRKIKADFPEQNRNSQRTLRTY